MKFITGMMMALLAAACGSRPSAHAAANTGNDSSFTIRGTAGGITKGVAILTYIVDKNVHADSSLIVNGSFSFSGSLQQPQEVGISFTNDDYNGGIGFFAENANITVTTDTASLDNPVIKGSASQTAFENFKKLSDPVAAKFEQLNKTGHAIFESGKLTKAVADSLFAISLQLDAERSTIIAGYVKANPDAVVSAWAISRNMLSEPKAATLEPLFNALSAKNQSGIYGSIIYEAIVSAKAAAIGQPAADFTQPDTSGKAVSLNSFRGKYILVDFWASWCGPCRAENPVVVKAWQQYKTKGFDILGVSLDTDKDAWIKAIKKDKLGWTAVSDLKGWKSETVTAYGIKGIPFNVLLDKNGIIIAKNLRGTALENKLEELFNKPACMNKRFQTLAFFYFTICATIPFFLRSAFHASSCAGVSSCFMAASCSAFNGFILRYSVNVLLLILAFTMASALST